MDLDKVLKKRASIRYYTSKKPKYDKIIDAIEAANLAPSPGNLPILKFIIIEDENRIQQIAKACQQEFLQNAQVIVVVCSEPKRVKIMYGERADKYIKHHAGASVENFLLKITDMGLVSCWVGAFSEVTIKNILKIPDEINVEVVLPIAYKAKADKIKQKPKAVLGEVVRFEDWNQKFQKPKRKTSTH